MQAVDALQIIRNPKKKEPPDGIRHEFPSSNCPSLFMRKKLRPTDFSGGALRIIRNVSALTLRAARMILRLTIKQQPQNQPGKAERSGKQESPTPSETHHYPRHDQRSDDGADVGASIENSCCQRACFFGEPFGDSFDT